MNTVTRRAISAAAALLAIVAFRTSVAEATPQPASAIGMHISHADLIRWLSDGERGLWVQASDRRWFYAGLAGACRGLNSTNSILFDTGASNRIDRTSSVVVPSGQRCRIRSFLPSNGPPKDRNKHVAEQPQTQ